MSAAIPYRYKYKGIITELTIPAIREAEAFATDMICDCIIAKAQHQFGARYASATMQLGAQHLGAHGEKHASLALEQPWPKRLNQSETKLPDLDPDIEVRTMGRAEYGLRVRPKTDDLSRRYVLVVPHWNVPTFRTVGWLWGHEAQLYGRVQNPGNVGLYYMVPQAALHSILTLKEELR